MITRIIIETEDVIAKALESVSIVYNKMNVDAVFAIINVVQEISFPFFVRWSFTN